MVAQYLDQHYDRVSPDMSGSGCRIALISGERKQFFTAYKGLILSPNYVTKRQSLKLLGEILLDRANYGIMTRYIASTENLQIIMNTLRDKSRNIQFEAFHVFKVSCGWTKSGSSRLRLINDHASQVFVANPNKPPAIANILRKNKDKLLAYLREFHKDREDELFNVSSIQQT